MTTKVRWVLGIVLGLLFGVLPWSLLLFGITADTVGAVVLFNFLAVGFAFALAGFMRKKVVKPMLGRGKPTRKQWIIIGGILIVCVGSSLLLFSLLDPKFREAMPTFGLLVFVAAFLRWQREAKYWFEQNEKLQRENEDLKRRLGTSI